MHMKIATMHLVVHIHYYILVLVLYPVLSFYLAEEFDL